MMLTETELQVIAKKAEESMIEAGYLDINLAASELSTAAKKMLWLLQHPNMRLMQDSYDRAKVVAPVSS